MRRVGKSCRKPRPSLPLQTSVLSAWPSAASGARATVLAADASPAEVEAAALADVKVVGSLDGSNPKKVIVIPGRMVNIVV